jgi:hypothetical protein
VEPKNDRALQVIVLCKQYRDYSLEPIDKNPEALHAELALVRLDDGSEDGSPLYPSEIATIVNYAYYRGDPRTIGAIMARK